MAEAIEEGVKMVQGVEVELKDHVAAEELADFDAIVVAVPTYHHDMTRNIQKLFEKAAVKKVSLKGKLGQRLDHMVGMLKPHHWFWKS